MRYEKYDNEIRMDKTIILVDGMERLIDLTLELIKILLRYDPKVEEYFIEQIQKIAQDKKI